MTSSTNSRTLKFIQRTRWCQTSVPVGDQSENSQADRLDEFAERAGAGGQGDQVTEVKGQTSEVSKSLALSAMRLALSSLGALLFALSVYVEAQEPTKIPRIGFVPSAGDANNPGPQVRAFQQGLRDLGYVEGKNILIEYRYVEGNRTRFRALSPNLCNSKSMCSSSGLQVRSKRLRRQLKPSPSCS
jgi:hypothetical protein